VSLSWIVSRQTVVSGVALVVLGLVAAWFLGPRLGRRVRASPDPGRRPG
jgi:hypothetical protein